MSGVINPEVGNPSKSSGKSLIPARSRKRINKISTAVIPPSQTPSPKIPLPPSPLAKNGATFPVPLNSPFIVEEVPQLPPSSQPSSSPSSVNAATAAWNVKLTTNSLKSNSKTLTPTKWNCTTRDSVVLTKTRMQLRVMMH